MAQENQPEASIRIIDRGTIRPKPRFSRRDIEYLTAIISGRLCYLSHIAQESGTPSPEHENANRAYRQLTELGRYMDAHGTAECELQPVTTN